MEQWRLTPFGTEATQAKSWLKCQPRSYLRLEAYGFDGLSEIDPETRYCMTVHERLMSEWILSLEPEHRTNRLATTAARKPGGSPGFSEMLKLLAASIVRRRNVRQKL